MTNPTTTDAPREGADEKDSLLDRITTGEGGIDFIGRTKLWYGITAALLLISVVAVLVRGFDLNIDFEGGTKLSMPDDDYVVEEVSEEFEQATGEEPELVQVVGSGDSATVEIHSERLTEEQANDAREALYERFQPTGPNGEPTPDAIGVSAVSESWGSTITTRMLISMVVFLGLAFLYIALRLRREMAIAAMAALLVDAVVIAGLYALFGFQVSPAAVIGFLTVLSFSIYDTVIVFDKVRENTDGLFSSRRQTYAEAANAAVNQTFMRSISTSVISALPIIALLVVAVWLLGVGDLKDLALIQFIGVIEGVMSSIFLATPILVSVASRSKRVREHNEEVRRFRAGEVPDAPEDREVTPEEGAEAVPQGSRRVSPPGRPADEAGERGSTTWRP